MTSCRVPLLCYAVHVTGRSQRNQSVVTGENGRRAQTARKSKPPYVVCRKDYCGSRPLIKGTKFPVGAVVHYILKQGLTPEELVQEFPLLTLAQVYNALSYYDHVEDLECELYESGELGGVER
ncbi:MAG: hypothetical protein KatS3mg131_2986 [Candidatus Tectimicrobiota bacterium]|nr:MAG: hypothetical protein KatS3mg131_2986 [Candidatus Tectomicrobia bacterium]